MRQIKVELVITGLNETHSELFYALNSNFEVASIDLVDGDVALSKAFEMSRKIILAAPSWYEVLPVIFAESPDGILHLIYKVLLNTRVKLASDYSWISSKDLYKVKPKDKVILSLGART